MTATDDVVRFTSTATPPKHAVSAARAQFDIIRDRTSGPEDTITACAPGAPGAINRAWQAALRTAGIGDWVSVGAAVFALQQQFDIPVARAAEAIAVGHAVADHLGSALRSTRTADRWSHRSVAGVVGAGAAAGRVLGQDETQLRHLIGLCATQAAGLTTVDEMSTGAKQLAKAAADAVEAAVLVRHGFTSSADGLGGRRGLFEVLAPGATWPEGLGQDWEPSIH